MKNVAFLQTIWQVAKHHPFFHAAQSIKDQNKASRAIGSIKFGNYMIIKLSSHPEITILELKRGE